MNRRTPRSRANKERGDQGSPPDGFLLIAMQAEEVPRGRTSVGSGIRPSSGWVDVVNMTRSEPASKDLLDTTPYL